MKSSSLVLGRGTLLQKTLASFAILAVLTLTVPVQAFAQVGDPGTQDTSTVTDPGTQANNPVDPGTPGTSTDSAPTDSQDVSTSTDNTDTGTPPLLRTFSFISPEEDTPGCKLVSDDVNTYIGTNPAVDTYTHPAWSTELNSDGAKWIWNAYHVSDPTQPETVTFTRSFNVSGSPGTATLKIAADNGYTVSLNGNPVSGCDGSGSSNFSSVDSCSLPVVSGTNTLTFTATNDATPGNSDPEANPAGLYYEVTVANATCTEVPPARTSTVTMCKVSDAEGHPGLPGWQLYLKGDLFNKITLNSASLGGVNSSWLTNGVQYLVTSMGTWSNQNGANLVDSEYSTTDNWTTHVDGYPGFGPGILELEVNNADTNWGPYNDSHTYSQIITGTGAQVHFGVFDGDTGTHTQNPSWYTDNSGKLFVDINSAYAGTTGENGCVTLHDVPFGTYTAGEIAQDGWTLTNITGAQGSVVDGNSVVVDSPTESFTFVNHSTVVTPPETQSCVIVSDATTLEGGEPSFVATFIHSAWTAVIDGASWIWGDPAITDPVNEQTQVFTKNFSLASAPATDATLLIAADNSYSVKVNGITVGSDAGEFNYTAAGQDSITIPAADLHAGANTLEFTVTNFAQTGGTQFTNPAGLKYKLTIGGTTCTQDAPTYKVHIFKYLDNGEGGIAQVPNDSNAPQFPMIATYSIAGVGTNLNPGDGYVLGNGGGVGGSDNGLLWAANTIPLHAGDVYGTHEVTGGDSPVVAEQCSPGKYYLEGYKVGDSLSAAQSATISQTAPNFENINQSEYVIVVNAACPTGNDGGGDGGNTTGTLTIVKDTNGGDGQFTFNIDASNEFHTSAQLTTSSGVGTSTVELANGTYNVTEATVDGWTYNNVSCSYDGENIGNTIPNGESITIINGSDITCTFHNTKNVIIPFVTFGSGGGGGGHGKGHVLGVSTTTEPQGQVLGATCTPILTSYLGLGKKNPIDQVIVLQNFLNGNLGITLPVSGFFGPLTFQAVKDFQTKYFSDVLTPWVPLGLPTEHTPTGYVYKTTKWMINHIACAEADGPKPQLP